MRRQASLRPRALRRLARNRDGVTIVEFAMVGPVLVLMIMGLFDMAHTQYTSSVLFGAMQKAGRDLTLESGFTRQSTIDAKVQDQVAAVMPRGATVTFQKLSHFDFTDVDKPEDYTDQNSNGRCDNNEPYVDSNDNSRWDADRGKDGIGGARDVVVYQATVTYPRIFPLFTMIGLSQNVTLTASTTLRNQPFDEQNKRITTVRNCT
ncbi:TadE/TadG family type IV pilus assembly protein [Erythrobacter sp. NE805]|uniref:TadE/TadG family type IV pilus assembly protein n=1 Tax=Erythrobacter sp. NE805 TaxID=3389875 RepID=UPI00396B12EF